MSQPFTHRNLPQLLLRAREELLRHFRPILTHYGVTEQQWRILRVISEHGQLEPREICELCQILSPSLSGVLARMQDLGWVTRTRMDEDQRRQLVRLTSQAEQLVSTIAPLIAKQYRHIEQAYGQQLIADTYATLDRFFAAQPTSIPAVALPPQAKPTAKRAGKALKTAIASGKPMLVHK